MGSESHSLVFSSCVSLRGSLFWNLPQAVGFMRETVCPEESTWWDWAVDLQSEDKTSPEFLRCEGQPDNKSMEKAGDGRFWTAVHLPSNVPMQPCVSDVHGQGWRPLWLQLASEPWRTFWGWVSQELFKAMSVMSPGLEALTGQWPLLLWLCEYGTNVESHT